MIPTAPINPAQQIDMRYSEGKLIEELVYNYPHNGGGTKRVENAVGVVTTTSVTGLEARVLTDEEKLASYKAEIALAITLEDIKVAAQTWL